MQALEIEAELALLDEVRLRVGAKGKVTSPLVRMGILEKRQRLHTLQNIKELPVFGVFKTYLLGRYITRKVRADPKPSSMLVKFSFCNSLAVI